MQVGKGRLAALTGADSPLRVIQPLLAAGYRPTVYRHVAPPQFLKRMVGRIQMLDKLDPFDCHGPELDSTRAGLPAICKPDAKGPTRCLCLRAGARGQPGRQISRCWRAVECSPEPRQFICCRPTAGWCLWRAAAPGAPPPTVTGQTPSRPLSAPFCWHATGSALAR